MALSAESGVLLILFTISRRFDGQLQAVLKNLTKLLGLVSNVQYHMYNKDIIFKQVLNQLQFESYPVSLFIDKKYITYLRARYSYLGFLMENFPRVIKKCK